MQNNFKSTVYACFVLYSFKLQKRKRKLYLVSVMCILLFLIQIILFIKMLTVSSLFVKMPLNCTCRISTYDCRFVQVICDPDFFCLPVSYASFSMHAFLWIIHVHVYNYIQGSVRLY